MARPRPEGQLDRILDAAERTFVRLGFDRARMSAIAEEAGISTATLYHYFESKDALLAWALQRARDPSIQLPDDLPIATPKGFRLTALLQAVRRAQAAQPELREALASPPSEALVPELRGLFTALYDRIYATRRLVDLVEAVAVRSPQLRDAWFAQFADTTVTQWAEYFESRASVLNLDGDPADAAVFVLTNCIYFARKQHGYIDSRSSHDATREAVVDLLVNALAGSSAA